MSFDSWYIEQFRDTLGEPLADSDSIPESAIDAALNGVVIPEALRAYYRVAGNHWLNTEHNELRTPGDLIHVDGYTVFMDENQFVVQWAIRDCDLNTKDPTVFQGLCIAAGHEWHAEPFTVSEFMIAMWRWVVTGELPS